MFDTTQYPYSLVPFRHGGQPGDQPRRRLEARRVRLRAADRRDRPERDLPAVGHRPGDQGRGQAPRDLRPGRRQEAAHRQRLHLQRQQADRPEGQSGRASRSTSSAAGPTGSPRCRSSPRTSRTSASTPPSKIEPDWNSWYPSASSHEGADAALAERLAGLALRVLLRQPAPERAHRRRVRTAPRPATGSTSRIPARRASSTSGSARSSRTSSRRSPRKVQAVWLKTAAGDPALHRAALVDLQHEVLPLLRVAEELLRRPDLHDVPRQRPLVHPDLPGCADRSVT